MKPTIGSVLCDRYRVDAYIGSGATARVYRVFDLTLKKEWALKVYRENIPTVYRAARDAEIRLLKRLHHPGMPRITDEIRTDRIRAVVMDYMSGMPMAEYDAKNGPLDVGTWLARAIALAEMLSHLHTLVPPVVYCDLKPGNIIIDESGCPQLLDFGAATGGIGYRFGTPGFAAPELLINDTGIDGRADIYSFGKTMETVPHVETRRSRILTERIIRRCTVEDVSARYPDIFALLEDLRNCQRRYRTRRSAPYRRTVLVLVTAVMLFSGISRWLTMREETAFATSRKEANLATDEERASVYAGLCQTYPERPAAYIEWLDKIVSDKRVTLQEIRLFLKTFDYGREYLQSDDALTDILYTRVIEYILYGPVSETDGFHSALIRIKPYLEDLATENRTAVLDALSYDALTVIHEALMRRQHLQTGGGTEPDDGFTRKLWFALKKISEAIAADMEDDAIAGRLRVLKALTDLWTEQVFAFLHVGINRATMTAHCEKLMERLRGLSLTQKEVRHLRDELILHLEHLEEISGTAWKELNH